MAVRHLVRLSRSNHRSDERWWVDVDDAFTLVVNYDDPRWRSIPLPRKGWRYYSVDEQLVAEDFPLRMDGEKRRRGKWLVTFCPLWFPGWYRTSEALEAINKSSGLQAPVRAEAETAIYHTRDRHLVAFGQPRDERLVGVVCTGPSDGGVMLRLGTTENNWAPHSCLLLVQSATPESQDKQVDK